MDPMLADGPLRDEQHAIRLRVNPLLEEWRIRTVDNGDYVNPFDGLWKLLHQKPIRVVNI